MKADTISGPLPKVALFDNYWGPTLVFAQSLGRRGIPIHVYGTGAARWSRYCTLRRSCPPVEDADRFIPWLRERVRSGEIVRVAPTTDLIAYYVSRLRGEFPPDVQRTIAPLSEIESALIKPRFAAACAAIGQAIPQALAPDDPDLALTAARELGYPLILKPKSHLVVGTAERGCLVANEAELRARYRPYAVASGQSELAQRYPELLWPLLQRYLPAARHQVFSVTGLKDADYGIVTASLSYKREQWPQDVGTSILQISLPDERILQAGLRVVDRLISCGIFELELVASDAHLLAIDLNPRAFGFINLDVALGHDLPWLWLRSTIGPLTPQSNPRPPVALEGRHTVLYFLTRLVQWRGRIGEEPQSERRDPRRPRAWISLLGQWRDPIPMLVSNARLLRNPRSLLMQLSVARGPRPAAPLPQQQP